MSLECEECYHPLHHNNTSGYCKDHKHLVPFIPCIIEGCGKRSRNLAAPGPCDKCYTRIYNHGSLEWKKGFQEPLEVLFWKYVDQPSPFSCWEWTGAINKEGRGQIHIGGRGGKTRRVYHVAWELTGHRPIKKGWSLDHLCRNILCVNPLHLEYITRGENTEREMQHRAAELKELRRLAEIGQKTVYKELAELHRSIA